MLNNLQIKKYFLFGCIPSRIFLFMLPVFINKIYLQYYSYILFLISSGFLFLYFINGRMNAIESGGSTWWSKYRIIHGMLYLIAATLAFNNYKIASIPLLIDAWLGLILHINK